MSQPGIQPKTETKAKAKARAAAKTEARAKAKAETRAEATAGLKNAKAGPKDGLRACRTCYTLGLAGAQTAVAEAVAHAARLGVRINVAVVDRAGTLLAFLRMDDAFLHSVELAIDKAYTAASFNAPTAVWPARFAGKPALVALGRRARMVPLAGGLPVRFADELVGGIGVSGGSAEEDTACARAACHALGADETEDEIVNEAVNETTETADDTTNEAANDTSE